LRFSGDWLRGVAGRAGRAKPSPAAPAAQVAMIIPDNPFSRDGSFAPGARVKEALYGRPRQRWRVDDAATDRKRQ